MKKTLPNSRRASPLRVATGGDASWRLEARRRRSPACCWEAWPPPAGLVTTRWQSQTGWKALISQVRYAVCAKKAPTDCADEAELRALSEPGVNGELTKFLWGREVIDLLLGFSEVKFAPAEFVGLLRKLQPRLYSISSSLKANPGQVHLTIAIVRYESLGRLRQGVCSSFLADRVNGDGSVPVFVHRNKSFRLPPDSSRPLIMVGPGTGIAPFRAFLEERRAVCATGKNWLFFGDQHEKTDFLYRDELEVMSRDGTLTRLTTAFSRDQEQKLYVQQRILENAKELYAWLEDGGHFYVCGDASRMAKDVDKALHQVIEIAGNRSPEQAAEYVRRLQTEKRYQRDVY